MKEKILLVGGGGHCRSVIDVVESEGRFEIMGIVEREGASAKKVLGYNVIGYDQDLKTLYDLCKYALVTVGQIETPVYRQKLYNELKRIGYRLPVIVSPLAYVSRYAMISEGTVVMHHALVNANAAVGANCILNTKSLIEHDVHIEAHCHISTGAIINGGAHIAEGTFFGSNAICKEYARISGFIKAGSVVR